MQFSEFLGDGQTEAETFAILHFPLELDVGVYAPDVLGRKSAPLVMHGELNFFTDRIESDAHG